MAHDNNNDTVSRPSSLPSYQISTEHSSVTMLDGGTLPLAAQVSNLTLQPSSETTNMSANDAPPATAQSNARPSSDSTAATSIPTAALTGTPLLSLWNELLLILAEKVAEADTEDADTAEEQHITNLTRALISFSSVNERLRPLSLSQIRIFKTIYLLKNGVWVPTNFYVSSRASPKETRIRASSFALHQFWASSNSTECASIAQGIKDILQAPTNLQCLHLDGEQSLAIFLEAEMEKAQFQFANLTEAIVSLEMSFLLKYMPKITRLSNKTHAGNNGTRVYTQTDKAAFYTHCRSLPRLKMFELTVADFEENAVFLVDIPDFGLETLAITRDASRCSNNPAVQDLQLVLINFLVKMALSQTSLTELRIPVSANIMVRSRVEHEEWEPNLDFVLVDVLPAAIIAAKVSSIKKIVVGRTSIINVLKKKEGLSILELHHDPLQVSNGLRTNCWHEMWNSWTEPFLASQQTVVGELVREFVLWFVYGEPDEPAAKITREGKEGRQFVDINVNNPWIKNIFDEQSERSEARTEVADTLDTTVLKLHHDPAQVADGLRTPY
ncbi:hypothetical protein IWZ03DRAFT_418731 [Phyllosticta citriasiana]|uniref:Mediator of RNA polymerase II transcription subunit 1 n=1 Tax=Phyllosticta citriasiana TaxID=595635 RepID=A0ABR1KAK7_9PEZI